MSDAPTSAPHRDAHNASGTAALALAAVLCAAGAAMIGAGLAWGFAYDAGYTQAIIDDCHPRTGPSRIAQGIDT